MGKNFRATQRLLAFLLFGCAAFGQQPSATSTQQRQNKMQPRYVGPGSCAAAACHGSVSVQKTSDVQQNEYSIWVVQDRHAKAYRALTSPISARMGKMLGIGNPAESPKCLTCHALAPSAAQRAREFDVSEGVSCESCHGPSSEWIGPHLVKGTPRPQLEALGMVNTKSVPRRAEVCLSCHLGDERRSVDHEMIAAGHPALVFDLESYSAAMPPHWKQKNDSQEILRTLAVGQAVQLRESLLRLVRRTQTGPWPEYSEYECFACHHSLTGAEKSWRQAEGYPDRKPGAPPWNAAHFSLLRVLAKQTQPTSSEKLEGSLTELFRVASAPAADRSNVSRAATFSAALSDSLAKSFEGKNFSDADARAFAKGLAAESSRLAAAGPRSAEQAAMVVESLAVILRSKDSPAYDAAVKQLFKDLENPSAYQAPLFAEHLRAAVAAMQ